MRFNPPPEFPELRNSIVASVARDQTGIDRADRSSDNPVRLDIRFIQSLIDARLVRSKRATTLKHQHYLARYLTFRPMTRMKIFVQAHYNLPQFLEERTWRQWKRRRPPATSPVLSTNGPATTNEGDGGSSSPPISQAKSLTSSPHPPTPFAFTSPF